MIQIKSPTDERAQFANLIFKEMFIKNDNDILSTIDYCRELDLFSVLENNIRNIYELVSVECQIPLMLMNEILIYGHDEDELTSDEFSELIKNVRTACIEFYSE